MNDMNTSAIIPEADQDMELLVSSLEVKLSQLEAQLDRIDLNRQSAHMDEVSAEEARQLAERLHS